MNSSESRERNQGSRGRRDKSGNWFPDASTVALASDAPRTSAGSRVEPDGLSNVQDLESVQRYAGRATRDLEFADRLVDAFRRQLERTEMHRDAFRGAEVQVRPYCFCRIHMDRLHEPARRIRTDRQQRQVERTHPTRNLLEERRIPGVAGEIDATAPSLDHKSA